MQSRSRVFDDISQLMTNAMGVAHGARQEAETAVNGMIDRWLADRDLVTREEFEAMRTLALDNQAAIRALQAEIEALKASKG